MKNDPLHHLVTTQDGNGIAPVTYDMVRVRAAELAVTKGLPAQPVSKSDWEQARKELAGEPDCDPSALPFEAAAESARWIPVSPSGEHRAPEPASEDENERRECARVVERTVADAERDRNLHAVREVPKSDRSES